MAEIDLYKQNAEKSLEVCREVLQLSMAAQNRTIRELKDRLKECEGTAKASLEKRLEQMTQNNYDQAEFAKTQREILTLASIPNNAWDSHRREDKAIVSDLNLIRNRIRAWSRDYTKQFGILETESKPKEYQQLLELLEGVLPVGSKSLPNGLQKEKGPATLLNALLNHDLHLHVYSQPFLCMEDKVLVHQETFEMFQKYDPQAAHNWRCNTLRELLPINGDDAVRFQLPELIRINIYDRLRIACRKIIKEFCFGPATLLMDVNKVLGSGGIQTLEQIYLDAAKQCYALGLHKISFVSTSLHQFPETEQVFDTNNPNLQPHSLVRHEKHEDNLKGRPIELMVHPALRLYGNYQGEPNKYEGEKDEEWVLIPGEVWVESAITA